MGKALLYESHSHTPLCHHAEGSPEAYAAVAEQRGLKGIIFTDHTPLPDEIHPGIRMKPDQWKEYVALIENARRVWQGRVDVRIGLEVDFYPHLTPWLERHLDNAQLHHVLGSIHFCDEYWELNPRSSAVEDQRTYFDNLAQSAETGLFDTLAHPDLVKNIYPKEWRLKRVLPDIQRALDRIASTGTAMELNTSGLNKAVPEMNPGVEILREMLERNIPVVLGADAHESERVGEKFEEALSILQDVGYTEVSFFLDRQRQDVPITAALQSLA